MPFLLPAGTRINGPLSADAVVYPDVIFYVSEELVPGGEFAGHLLQGGAATVGGASAVDQRGVHRVDPQAGVPPARVVDKGSG